MNGALVALLLLFGFGFLAVGLIYVSLPLSGIAISMPGLFLGAGCAIFGIGILWFVRTEAKSMQAQQSPPADERSFWWVLWSLNLIWICVTAVLDHSWWLFGFAVAGALALLTRELVRARGRGSSPA